LTRRKYTKTKPILFFFYKSQNQF